MAKSTRNEFEFMSMVLDALGVEYEEADIKVRERWRSKVLDGWGVDYVVDDLKQFARWRKKCLEGLAKNHGGGGGGSSNTKKTVTGTLANPFGDIDVADLCSKLQTMDATAYLTIDATALRAGTIVSRPFANSTYFWTNGASINDSVASSSAYSIQWAISDGSLYMAEMISGGNLVDISSYASALTTSMTVVYHPISE